jgi:DNA invertase Pin-like site-specific DNA recombinase
MGHRSFIFPTWRSVTTRLERDLIRTRTAEGRSRAQKRGQHMGRPPKLTDAQKAEARRRRAEGATLAELARSYGVGKNPDQFRSIVYRLNVSKIFDENHKRIQQ